MSSKREETLQRKLQEAQERVKHLKAQQAEIAARKRAAEEKKQRADETRKKILLGSYVMSQYSADQILEMMSGYLEREHDRALFDLPPLPSTSQP